MILMCIIPLLKYEILFNKVIIFELRERLIECRVMLNDVTKIQTLPDDDGDLIKATVTISSVSHCLRELIENSLDASSKIISIKINNCGLESIIVSDDGCGINQSDLNMICSEGATSKDIKFLSETNEILSNVNPFSSQNSVTDTTLPDPNAKTKVKCFSNFSGGRGRALGSISNISYLTIESSCNNSGSGFRLTFTKDGERIIQPVSRLKGTSVCVQSLFYAYPVRRHHLLQRKTEEYRDIEEVITAFSISTKATINVSIDGKTIVQVHSANFVHRIKSVLGSEVSSHLIHGKVDLSDWFHDTFLEFYTTPLDGNVNGRVYLSVNGRPTVNMNIIRGIRNEYRSCNGNKWPVVCLMIKTAARESYEFTPDSPLICTEFVKEEMLRSIICTALCKAWNGETDSSFSFTFPSMTTFYLTSEKVGEQDSALKNGRKQKSNSNFYEITKFKSTRPTYINKNVVYSSLTTDKIIERFRNGKNGFKDGFGARNTVINQSSFAQMEIIGQWNKAFIITRLGADIFAIDQHAACEAVNFENLKKEKQKKAEIIKKQILLTPVILNVPQEDIENAKIFTEKCSELGFDYEIIEVDKEANESPDKYGILVKSIPSNKSTATGLHDLQEILALMRDVPQSDHPRSQNSKSRMMYIACHSSVRVGDTLSMTMMKKILNQMAESDSPWNCPHGRPTWCCIEELQSG